MVQGVRFALHGKELRSIQGLLRGLALGSLKAFRVDGLLGLGLSDSRALGFRPTCLSRVSIARSRASRESA